MPAMWPICLTRRKRPSSSKRLRTRRQPIGNSSTKEHSSADPNDIGGGPGRTWSSRETTMKDRITIEGHDGAFAAYIARPKTLPAPAVVVLQELFGVNADIRKHCDELAEQCYLAGAPDLYWRQEPGVDLNVTSQADWDHGLRLYSAYDRDAGVRDIKDTIDAVRSLPECNGKVALLGYCLGALMVFMTAVRNDGIDAVVWYHGADTDKYLGELDGLHAPILMHLAEEDEFIPKAAQAEIKAAVEKKPNTTVY